MYALGLETEVCLHSSDPPDPWAGYKACLRDPPHCTHLLIVQDDVIPVRNFSIAVQRIAERNPTTPVCLFLGAAPQGAAGRARRAMQKGRPSYVDLGPTTFVPLVAVLWPRPLARDLLLWAKYKKGLTRADDGNVAKWARETKTHIRASVPSIVQHDDGAPSVKGGREHKPWKESWRQALFLAEDALVHEW